MEIKKCGTCNLEKPFTEFSKAKNKKFGLASQCKLCHAEYRREHYKKNKEKILKQVNSYRNKHPEKYIKKFNQPNKKAGRIIESNCLICNKLIYVTKKDIKEKNKKYCSRICRYNDKKSDYYLYLKNVKKRAKLKNFDFDLTETFLKDLLEVNQNNLCGITNLPIKVKGNNELKTLYDTASLDRKDSNKGYVKGNVRWVILGVNYMKLNYTDEELHKTLKLIKENY